MEMCHPNDFCKSWNKLEEFDDVDTSIIKDYTDSPSFAPEFGTVLRFRDTSMRQSSATFVFDGTKFVDIGGFSKIQMRSSWHDKHFDFLTCWTSSLHPQSMLRHAVDIVPRKHLVAACFACINHIYFIKDIIETSPMATYRSAYDAWDQDRCDIKYIEHLLDQQNPASFCLRPFYYSLKAILEPVYSGAVINSLLLMNFNEQDQIMHQESLANIVREHISCYDIAVGIVR